MDAPAHNPTQPATIAAAEAEAANYLHTQIVASLTDALHKSKQLGDLLNGVKASLRHGAFQEWCTAHLDFSTRTAQTYMRVAREWGRLEGSGETNLAGALRRLSGANTKTAKATETAHFETTAETTGADPVDVLTALMKPTQADHRTRRGIAIADDLYEVLAAVDLPDLPSDPAKRAPEVVRRLAENYALWLRSQG